MPDPSVAFLAQPIQMMARRGEDFTLEVIETLRRWMVSNYVETVRAERDGVFALSSTPDARWNLVVMRDRSRGTDADARVCGLEFGSPMLAVDHFLPLIAVDHLPAAMHVHLGKIEPRMFTAVATGHAYLTAEENEMVVRQTPHHQSAAQIVAQVDASGHRWGSSQARRHFKDVFERAREQPQIVERGDGDLLVMSRTYLQELVSPTGARAMAHHFRRMALSAEGMVDTAPGTLDALEALPPIGTA
jgi:hypothetical protein